MSADLGKHLNMLLLEKCAIYIYIYKYTCTLDLSVAENIEAMSLEIGISEDECTS